MCEKCSHQPKIAGDNPNILDPNLGVRLTYDITLEPALYDIPFTEYLEYVDRTLEKMKRAIYNRARESYIERGTQSLIKERNGWE